MSLGLWLLVTATALANDLDGQWALGLEVAQVSLEAPEGGLPDENLEPLLRVRQGERLDAKDVRTDLALLQRIGEFAAAEARVEPWVSFDENGVAFDAVHLIYEVHPATRVRRIHWDGLRGGARRAAELGVTIDLGDAYYERDQKVGLEHSIEHALLRDGWPAATIDVQTEPVGPNEVDLVVVGDAGLPYRYGKVDVVGNPGIGRRRLARILSKNGLEEGDRMSVDREGKAREAVRDALVADRWLQARVSILAPDRRAPGDPVTLLVDAGVRTEVRIEGTSLVPAPEDLLSVLGLNAGDRIDGVVIEQAGARLADWYAQQGYREAAVQGSSVGEGGSSELLLQVTRGTRHHLERKVVADGAVAYDAKFIGGAMREAEPETLGVGVVTDDAVERACTAVEEFYRAQGYLDADLRLTQVQEERRRDRRVHDRLVLAVSEGPRTVLSQVRVDGGSRIEDDAISERLRTALGGPFSPAAAESLGDLVADAYRESGHLDVQVAVETQVHDGQHQADVTLRVDPGPEIRVRALVVRGLRRTRRSTVVRGIPIEVGGPITPSRLAEARSNLYTLDVFKTVSPTVVDDDESVRDVVIQVDEKPNILLQAGGGLATDQGVQLRLNATHRNLGGLAHRVSAQGQVGYAWVADRWSFDTAAPVWRAALRYEAPYVPWRHQTLVTEVLLNETLQKPNYRLSQSGASVGLELHLGRIVQGLVDYELRFRRMDDVNVGALVQGDPWMGPLGVTSPLDPNLALPSAFRTIGTTGLFILVDGRDSRIAPTSGWQASSRLQLADSIVGDQTDLRLDTRVERLIPLGHLRGLVRALGGIGWAPGAQSTLPLEDRFTLGGTGTVRGLPLDVVGPANEVARPDIDFPNAIEPWIDASSLASAPSYWVPTGGDFMVGLTVELRVPFPSLGFSQSWDALSLVLFSDSGRVAFLDPAVRTTSSVEGLDPVFRSTLGVGVQMNTPIGPASLDLGFNPWPLEERGEPVVRPHGAIGSL